MKIIYIDAEKCVACRNCELACATAHSQSKDHFKAINESPAPKNRIRIIGNEKINLPVQCRHCVEALCVEICPKNALKKEGDTVQYNEELCIGCRFCILACPFGAIQYLKEKKKTLKCDHCIERLKNNEEPACTFACPTSALTYIEADQIEESDFVKENSDNQYLFVEGKAKVKRLSASKEKDQPNICRHCGKEMKSNKKIEELKTKIKNKALLELLEVHPECRSQYILNSIKIKEKELAGTN